jgi:hypothetical protein
MLQAEVCRRRGSMSGLITLEWLGQRAAGSTHRSHHRRAHPQEQSIGLGNLPVPANIDARCSLGGSGPRSPEGARPEGTGFIVHAFAVQAAISRPHYWRRPAGLHGERRGRLSRGAPGSESPEAGCAVLVPPRLRHLCARRIPGRRRRRSRSTELLHRRRAGRDWPIRRTGLRREARTGGPRLGVPWDRAGRPRSPGLPAAGRAHRTLRPVQVRVPPHRSSGAGALSYGRTRAATAQVSMPVRAVHDRVSDQGAECVNNYAPEQRQPRLPPADAI